MLIEGQNENYVLLRVDRFSQLSSTDIIWHLDLLIIIYPNKTSLTASDSSDMCRSSSTFTLTFTQAEKPGENGQILDPRVWLTVNRLNLNYSAYTTETHLEVNRYRSFSGWWRYLVKQWCYIVLVLIFMIYG